MVCCSKHVLVIGRGCCHGNTKYRSTNHAARVGNAKIITNNRKCFVVFALIELRGQDDLGRNQNVSWQPDCRSVRL